MVLILKVGKCVLQLVENLAFIPCVHLASIGKYVLRIELKLCARFAFSLGGCGGLTAHVERSDRCHIGLTAIGWAV